MICMNVNDVSPVQVSKRRYEGKIVEVTGTLIRWLTHRNRGGDEYQHNHALRHFTISPKGNIPMHGHKYTEIVYVLSGKGNCSIIAKDGKIETLEIGPGDFIYTYAYEPHAFTNDSSSKPLVFLCCIDCIDDKENCLPTAGC